MDEMRRALLRAPLLLLLHDCQPPDDSQSNSPRGARDIPEKYLRVYRAAGKRYGIDWAVLAGIGKAESDHGRYDGPGVKSGTNAAGAAGPMQFGIGKRPRRGHRSAGNAWKTYGGDGMPGGRFANGDVNVYDFHDAIPAAARYLVALGLRHHLERALYGYNNSDAYVRKVLSYAAAYRAAY